MREEELGGGGIDRWVGEGCTTGVNKARGQILTVSLPKCRILFI